MKKKLILEWSQYVEYTFDNVQKYAPNDAGVYKIGFVQNDGKLRVCYVGQAQDIDTRLKQHLNLDNEQNECLRERLKKYKSEFSFAKVATQENRNGVERALYYHYTPTCNDPDAIPNGPEIDVNLK